MLSNVFRIIHCSMLKFNLLFNQTTSDYNKYEKNNEMVSRQILKVIQYFFPSNIFLRNFHCEAMLISTIQFWAESTKKQGWGWKYQIGKRNSFLIFLVQGAASCKKLSIKTIFIETYIPHNLYTWGEGNIIS